MDSLAYRAPKAVHGTNPQFLIEKVIRSRIYDSLYWKSTCFALNAESMVEVAALQLPCIGGSYGGSMKPTEFMSLMLKLLQLQPEREILLEYLAAQDFKYLRALAAFYVRLVFPSFDVYTLLEPMLEDYRKLRYRNMDGSYRILHMDEFVDNLLNEERVCDIILPRMVKREILEEKEALPPRASMLEEVLLEGEEEDEAEAIGEEAEADRERRRRWRERVARGKLARDAAKLRSAEEEASLGQGHENGRRPREILQQPRSPGESNVEYASQEESEADEAQRYISRSPSRSATPDRGVPDGEVAASVSPEHDRYISRSPSPGSDRDV